MVEHKLNLIALWQILKDKLVVKTGSWGVKMGNTRDCLLNRKMFTRGENARLSQEEKKNFIAQLLKECISRKFTQVSFKCMLNRLI